MDHQDELPHPGESADGDDQPQKERGWLELQNQPNHRQTTQKSRKTHHSRSQDQKEGVEWDEEHQTFGEKGQGLELDRL